MTECTRRPVREKVSLFFGCHSTSHTCNSHQARIAAPHAPFRFSKSHKYKSHDHIMISYHSRASELRRLPSAIAGRYPRLQQDDLTTIFCLQLSCPLHISLFLIPITMFAQRCTRFLVARPVVPSTSYLNRAGRTFSTTAAKNYETLLISNPKPNVGLSM